MTQNEVSIIKNAVLDATEAYVDARLKVADFVKTQIGVVTASEQRANKKWYHTVSCNATQSNPYGIVYTEVLSINNIHFVDGSVVFILAPNAQFSNQFILGKLDNVPYDLSISGIDIGNGTFVVDSNGKCTIKSGEINLTLKHDSRISTDTYNIILDANGEKIGAHVVDRGSGQNPRYVWGHYFNVDSNGNVNITKGTIDIGGNFSVTSAGKVTIKSGSININNKFYADDQGNLAVGGTSSSANFYVDNTGKVKINSGTISIGGNFEVTDGGVVTIKSGSITLANKLKIDSQGWLAVGGTTSSANFYVDNTGHVTAKNLTATVGGTIGCFSINNTSLYNGTDVLLNTETIAVGKAGNGIAMLRGHTNDNIAYIQFSASGSPTTCIDGFRLYANGVIQHYDGSGSPDWNKNFSNI